MIAIGPVTLVSCLWSVGNGRHFRKQTELGCSCSSSAELLCKVRELYRAKRVSCCAAGESMGKCCKGTQQEHWRQTCRREYFIPHLQIWMELNGSWLEVS